MRIGVDVGGTNTDAVLMEGTRVHAAMKSPTTADVSSGIRAAITACLEQSGTRASAVRFVMIGTTHFTNAFVQARGLARVAVVRIGFPAARDIPPFFTWPDHLAAQVRGAVFMVGGGYQFDGREIGPLDEDAVARAAGEIAAAGLRDIAISGVFSGLNDAQEKRAAEILQAALPVAQITLSSQIGRTGLLERENAAIMNASLRPMAAHVVAAFENALHDLGLNVPFFISQNDGTLMRAEQVRRYPVLTFAAGPTNSLRGAAFLTGHKQALVADIGGTTTDIGMLTNGFPRQTSVHVDVGGVRTNFRMPDILSIGLGGGSRVRATAQGITVGPDSVGYRLLEEGLVFGGDTLTTSDIAVASGQADFGDRQALATLSADTVSGALDVMHQMMEDALDRMKTTATALPLILVGGGAILISRPLAGISETVTPDHAAVANAVGAAIGQVGGEVDKVFSTADGGRDAAVAAARAAAIRNAVDNGADPASVEVVELEEIPLQYLPSGAVRIFCRAVGELAGLSEAASEAASEATHA